VDTVYAVDPRIVPEVRHGISEMTYREMRELAYAGFGVLPRRGRRAGLPRRHPHQSSATPTTRAPGTLVCPGAEADTCSVVGIASDTGFVAIYVDKYMMNREIGFGRRLLQILEDEGISFEHMPSGIDNVSVVIREARFDAAREERVVARIQGGAEARRRAGRARPRADHGGGRGDAVRGRHGRPRHAAPWPRPA
jgi:aspartate kinase